MIDRDIRRRDSLKTMAGDSLTLICLEDEIESLLAAPTKIAIRVF